MPHLPAASPPLTPRRALVALLGLAAVAGGCDGCSDDTGETSSSTTSGSGGGSPATTSGGGSGDGGSDAAPSVTASGSGGGCEVGTPCDGGTCDETGACCPNESLCGTVCCGDGTVCAFLECIAPGHQCFDDNQCEGDEYCDFSLGDEDEDAGGGGTGGGDQCASGVAAPEGKCMPRPPLCPDGTEPGDPPSCVTSCEYHPEIGVFSPELKYSWGDPLDPTNNVMMAPIVIQLDDDDCDGAITERDIPEIVFFTFDGSDYNNGSHTASTLRAISIVDGEVVEKLAIGTDGDSADAPGRSIAGGDIDGDGDNEIVVCTVDNRTRAYHADGTEMWLSAASSSCYMPSLADLDQDGTVEIVDRASILDGATGAHEGTFPIAIPVVSDVDGDGVLDIVTPNAVYDATGAVKVTVPLVGTHAAVGDLDLDGSAEIVTVDTQTHTVHVWRVTGPGTYEIVREALDINEGIDPNPCCVANPNNAGCTRGGGAPTIARFNEDDYPDVALAGGIGYVVFDGQALMDGSPVEEVRLWLRQTQDCSSAQTGSSVFDFDGDGVAEVVYADERTLHIYAGPTGEPLFETCSTNGTLVEYPLVADVDNDGHADIVVGSNSYSGFTCEDGSKTTGIRVFGDLEGKWVRTRRVWNQHAYHVTNVEESGAIPTVEETNHLVPGLNNFRQNVQPTGQFAAPDLVVSVVPICSGPYRLRARVINVGEAPVEPGVPVGFYGAEEGLLGQVPTTKTLYPLTYEDLELEVSPVDGDVYAIVDDGMPAHSWHECRTDNNRSDDVAGGCGVPN